MFIAIKKKTVIYIFAILLAISVVVVCLATKEAKKDIETNYDPEPISVLEGKTILIDAGHGGFDAGASANGAVEKDINLGVALKLRDLISEKGGNAIMTRDSDGSTEDKSRKDGSTAKKSDLRRRKAMADECGADAAISIHMNKFDQAKYWGAQVFYAEKSEESKLLGESIQQAMRENLKDGNERVPKESNGKIFLLKNVARPTVIVECGFLSNPKEAKKLTDNAYQEQLASAICIGIENFFR